MSEPSKAAMQIAEEIEAETRGMGRTPRPVEEIAEEVERGLQRKERPFVERQFEEMPTSQMVWGSSVVIICVALGVGFAIIRLMLHAFGN